MCNSESGTGDAVGRVAVFTMGASFCHLQSSNANHCALSALDTACVCFKVSVSAVFCLDILQLYSIGLSFVWHSVYFVQLWMY